ncbi:solute carrier family 28 member 3 [Aplysia californica]|uniref:Solute carrier family 28 member 3 n=1 Tax=Aplysia californica TaxID=6500 RepID=A0ABM0JBF5_APLCA|nr:solute carrier family 28 member 3 [Aplysia californica]
MQRNIGTLFLLKKKSQIIITTSFIAICVASFESLLRYQNMKGNTRNSYDVEAGGDKSVHAEEMVDMVGLEDGAERSHTEDMQPTKVTSVLLGCRQNVISCCSTHKRAVSNVLQLLFFIGLCVYLGFAFHHSFGDEQSVTLLAVSCVLTVACLYSKLSPNVGMAARKACSSISSPFSPKTKSRIYWIALSLMMTSLVLYVLVDTALSRPRNLISALGVLVFVALMFCLSKDPGKVRWRPVVWGLLLQFVFGLLVLRTRWGYASFQWLADRVTEYLDHTDKGTSFVFGKSYGDHFFAFRVMSTIIVFSSTISVLYHLGAMQIAIDAITHIIRVSLGTGPMETLHAAFNIFVGWAETIPVVKPLLDQMTKSELHAIMTNGFSTVSGGAMAAYILYGAPANHLISASFMSAPAALAMGKLFYPENVPGRRKQKAPVIPRSTSGVIEAASAGAVSAIPLIAYILVHAIAFLSILDFINDTLAWLGARVGIAPPNYPVLSFQFISSYLLWPVAFLMGVVPDDCRVVARMLGVKVFVNEFLAFEDLGKVRSNNVALLNYTTVLPNATWSWTQTDDVILDMSGLVLKGGVMSERSATIATYALCGFSDLLALGMMVGALTAVTSHRKRDVIDVAPRALFSGVMACFLTAAMSGLLID